MRQAGRMSGACAGRERTARGVRSASPRIAPAAAAAAAPVPRSEAVPAASSAAAAAATSGECAHQGDGGIDQLRVHASHRVGRPAPRQAPERVARHAPAAGAAPGPTPHPNSREGGSARRRNRGPTRPCGAHTPHDRPSHTCVKAPAGLRLGSLRMRRDCCPLAGAPHPLLVHRALLPADPCQGTPWLDRGPRAQSWFRL